MGQREGKAVPFVGLFSVISVRTQMTMRVICSKMILILN